jgi:gliding motility-associated-like protein
MKRLQLLLVVLLYFTPGQKVIAKTPPCDGHIDVTITAGTIACNGGTTTVNVTATGGIAPYSGVGTFTVSAGTYTYYVSGVCGSGSATVTITEPTFLNAFMSWEPIECYGGSAVTMVSAFGGTGPYSGTGNYTVTAGTQSVVVTDANGCTATASMTFTEPPAFIATATAGTIPCFGGTTTVSVTATGGTDPYSGTGTFTVTAGSYTYTVTDTHGCNTTANITVDEPEELSIVTAATEISCSPNSLVTIASTGGTGICTGTGTFTVGPSVCHFTVTDANGCTATTSATSVASIASVLEATAEFSAITCFGGTTTVTVTATGGTEPYMGTGTFTASAGMHDYTVTDANGCTSVTTINIVQPDQLSATTAASPIQCFGGTTTIDITAIGGTAPYSGTGTQTVSAGSYSYTVTDANGCVSSTSITISQPDALMASATADPIKCHGATTAVSVTATGGSAPYSGTSTFTVPTGTHDYTVTDVNGCSTTASITLADPPILSIAATSPGIRCHGDTTTVNVFVINGGLAPYSGTGTYSITAGTHYYTVTDANGCTGSTAITIGEPTLLTAVSAANNILCHGGTTVVTVSADGGSTPYTGTGTYTVTAGTYSYIITDANGCALSTETVTITEPSQLTAVADHGSIKCSGGSTSVTISGMGGIAPYNYTGNFTATAGDHVYTIADANGCEASILVTLTEPAPLKLMTSSTNAGCNGGHKGTATITPVGGTPPYVYAWSVITFDKVTSALTGLTAGAYQATVTDNNGCSEKATIVVNPGEYGESKMLLTPEVSNPLCFGSRDGAININVTGGTAPFSFVWSTGASTAGINGLLAGKYEVKVTDEAGCDASTTVVLEQPQPIIVSLNPAVRPNGMNISTHGGSNGAIECTASGGTAPYFYSWSNGSTARDLDNIPAGIYGVVVTDKNGCVADLNTALREPGIVDLPTGFTPNGDGANDYFIIPGLENYPDNLLEVFNRWGNKVWETKGYTNNWSGTNSNQEQLPEGTYYIIFTVNGGEFVKTGYVDIRR